MPLVTKCEEAWCKFIKDPEGYKPRNLPYGKYLSGENLLTDLISIFNVFSDNAEKLCSTESPKATKISK